jgi:Tfp pilus assembly protein PilF
MSMLKPETSLATENGKPGARFAIVQRPLWRQPAAVYLALFVLACVPYMNTLSNSFVYDDGLQVLQNPLVQNAHNFGKIFTAELWEFEGNESHSKYYRPLMTLAMFALHEIYGDVPIGYHIANVALGGLVVCLLYAVTIRWTGNSLIAWLAACIFALHPIHSEVIAWITAITDLEGILFVLLAFWLFLDLPNVGARVFHKHVLMTAAFALAMFSKETVAPFVVLATLFEHFYRTGRENTSLSIKMGRYVPLWAVLVGYFCIRRVLLGALQPAAYHLNLSWSGIVLTGFALFAKYLGKLAWPYPLQAFYTIPPRNSVFDPLVLAGLLMAALILALTWTLRRRQPVVSFGLLWLLLFLGPALNYRWFGMTPFAERYAFLPSVGFCWCVAIAGAELWRRAAIPASGSGDWQRLRLVSRAALLSSVAIVAILCVVHIWRRNTDWRDDQTFYKKILQDEPGAAVIRTNLGAIYLEQGKVTEGKAQLVRAVRDSPHQSAAWTNLALLAIRENDFASAESYLENARKSPPVTARYYHVHALLLEKQGRKATAVQELWHAVQVSPRDSSSQLDLARMLTEQGQADEATQQLLNVLNGSMLPESWCDAGDLALQLDRTDIAEQAYQRALDANPFHPLAHAGLGRVYDQRGNRQKALKEYRAALVMDPRSPVALEGIHRLEQP